MTTTSENPVQVDRKARMQIPFQDLDLRLPKYAFVTLLMLSLPSMWSAPCGRRPAASIAPIHLPA